ncbi:MAG: FAD-binding protein, partial [Alphaproteobacteria bacterium]
MNEQETPAVRNVARLDFGTDAAIVVGAGPAGLMAAETLRAAGVAVHCFDAMPSAGRKFLLAGRGGLNLTHSESAATFIGRFGPRGPALQPLLERFGAQHMRDWAQGLGVDTFVGTSGRVFPTEMKAAP